MHRGFFYAGSMLFASDGEIVAMKETLMQVFVSFDLEICTGVCVCVCVPGGRPLHGQIRVE